MQTSERIVFYVYRIQCLRLKTMAEGWRKYNKVVEQVKVEVSQIKGTLKVHVSFKTEGNICRLTFPVANKCPANASKKRKLTTRESSPLSKQDQKDGKLFSGDTTDEAAERMLPEKKLKNATSNETKVFQESLSYHSFSPSSDTDIENPNDSETMSDFSQFLVCSLYYF